MYLLPYVDRLHTLGLLRPAAALSRFMAEEEASKIEAQHARAAIEFERGRLSAARTHFRAALELDKLHVTAPIRYYYAIERRLGAAQAQAYLTVYLEERNAAIYRQIDLYVDWLRTSRYVDFPLAVHIETLALCNAQCHFCQYPELTRKGDLMPEDLVVKIVDELRAVPADLPLTITLAGVSEPLLDKRIFDHIARINEVLPQVHVAINTNGAPLTERNIERLSQLKIAWMGVSVNDYRKAEYEDSMKISYDRMVAVLDMLQRKLRAKEIPFPIGITRAGDGSIHDLHFLEWAQSRYPEMSRNFSPQFAWVGDALPTLAPLAYCSHWFDITVRSTGQVAFCCIDGHITHPWGDLKAQHILDVYNQPAYRRLRTETVTRRDVEQCRTCSSG